MFIQGLTCFYTYCVSQQVNNGGFTVDFELKTAFYDSIHMSKIK